MHFTKDWALQMTEDEARVVVKDGGNVVIVHTEDNCPVCDYFVPEVFEKLVDENDFYKEVKIIEITDKLFFPVKEHPTTYFYKDGKCITWAVGSAPQEPIINMFNRFYFGGVPQ